MRADPADYEMLAPESLHDVVALMSGEPGAWLPIAGGTDVMVQYGAGTLRARKLVSIWNLHELRRIEEGTDEITIGAGSTYTDLRKHPGVAREFPLLTRAAAWTGGIANQNRGTLGGNIANASPAADCLPALLAYDAELTLISVRGERTIPYREFHTGYKKTVMGADELIRAVHLKKKFANHAAYARKVGARQSQAIAKVSIAALGRLGESTLGPVVDELHIALGSVAPVPLRLHRLEQLLIGQPAGRFSADELRHFVAAEVAPIADIRSTAEYRARVAGNLVMEFLDQLQVATSQRARTALAHWNGLTHEDAARSILPCCGARSWADAMASRRPFESVPGLIHAAREVWRGLETADWLEAFRSHPRIGESHDQPTASIQSQTWSSQEQRAVAAGSEQLKLALSEGNRQYEERFGRIFIVCAAGKPPAEILEILQRRLHNGEATELLESAKEQQQIMEIRLHRWLGE